MIKKVLLPGQVFEIRQALQIAALDALTSSRRWAPGDLIFQGGTSLHLVHGSPRFSEDLDFLVNSTLDLSAIASSVQQRLAGVAWLPSGTALSVSKAKDLRNPHTFIVKVGGKDIIHSASVKVELWQTDVSAMAPLKVSISTVRAASGLAAGAQAFVPTADLREIYVDKVFALAARAYLKPRDVFDLHWLRSHAESLQCSSEDLRLRLATYPGETPALWLQQAHARAEAMPAQAQAVADDLRRWLPSSWPMDVEHARPMIEASLNALQQGIEAMRPLSRKSSRTRLPSRR